MSREMFLCSKCIQIEMNSFTCAIAIKAAAMIEVFGSINLRFFIEEQLEQHLQLYFLFIFHCSQMNGKQSDVRKKFRQIISLDARLPQKHRSVYLLRRGSKEVSQAPRLYLRSLFLSSSNYHQFFEIISRRSSLAGQQSSSIAEMERDSLKERKAKHSTFSAQSRLIKFTNVEAHIGGSL